MRYFAIIVFAFSLCSFLAACGQKGPLKLPPDAALPVAGVTVSGAMR